MKCLDLQCFKNFHKANIVPLAIHCHMMVAGGGFSVWFTMACGFCVSANHPSMVMRMQKLLAVKMMNQILILLNVVLNFISIHKMACLSTP